MSHRATAEAHLLAPRQPVRSMAGSVLTHQAIQGQHGEGVIYALACSAGLLVSSPKIDVDGIDWEIGWPGTHGEVRSPKIEVQVKSWSTGPPPGADLRYRMRARHFNAIAGPGFLVPRFLIVVLVPRVAREYVSVDHEATSFHRAAYWVALADAQPVDVTSGNQTVLVTIPRRNLLTPAALRALVAGEEAVT